MSTIGLWLASDPYDAWFRVHQLLGTLTIPLAFVAGKLLTGRRAAGIVLAALVAFWPQHIRISASEVTHVHLVFWTFLAINFALLAGRNGKLLTFATLAFTTAAATIMRPEAPLILPGIALLALGAGSGVRSKWRSLPRWLVLGFVAWLVIPTYLTILGDKSIGTLTDTDQDQRMSLLSLLHVLKVAVVPDGQNAYFDPQTSPMWLWPLAIFGGVMLWRRKQRVVALGFATLALLFLTLYTALPPSTLIWKISRYHAALFPAVAILTGVGLWVLLERLPWTRTRTRRRLTVGVGVAAIGCALWSPALLALPLDWQQGHQAMLALGRKHPVLWKNNVRIVTPDNRRRFLDLAPRSAIMPLTRGRQDPEMAVTVAHAAKTLHVGDDNTEAYFYGGLYCYFAVVPGETFNPQCQAMFEIFEMEKVDAMLVTEGPYLTAYATSRVEGTLELGLYRIGKRKLAPSEAVKLIPKPVGRDARHRYPGVPMGSGHNTYMKPPTPPIGVPLGPHFRHVPW